jgi:hypothetical protein
MRKRLAKKRKKKMDEIVPPEPPTLDPDFKDKDKKNRVQLSIIRPPDGQVLEIHIRAPVVANIVRSMAESNYPAEKYDAIYKPILLTKPDPTWKGRVATRAAISRCTRNIEGGVDFSFESKPRSILLANPDMLEAGYILTYKVTTPVPPDQIRRWGKEFMDGCADIIANARAFRMNWVMDETVK